MGLKLSRRVGETLHLSAQPGTDAQALLEALTTEGITLEVAAIEGSQIRLYIEAPQELLVLRGELLGER